MSERRWVRRNRSITLEVVKTKPIIAVGRRSNSPITGVYFVPRYTGPPSTVGFIATLVGPDLTGPGKLSD
jgi:hypothetical protein